jgi:Tfp pilus assembly protein PilO
LPLARTLASEQTQLEELRGVSLSRSTLAAQLAENQKATEETNQQILQMADRFHPTANVPAAIKGLADLAAETNVKLLDLQPLSEQKYEKASLQPLQCRMEANWESLCRFLSQIHEIHQPIRVERIQLGTASDEQFTPVAMDLSLIFAPADSVLGRVLASVRLAPGRSPARCTLGAKRHSSDHATEVKESR